jgi:hypothetical protein
MSRPAEEIGARGKHIADHAGANDRSSGRKAAALGGERDEVEVQLWDAAAIGAADHVQGRAGVCPRPGVTNADLAIVSEARLECGSTLTLDNGDPASSFCRIPRGGGAGYTGAEHDDIHCNLSGRMTTGDLQIAGAAPAVPVT